MKIENNINRKELVWEGAEKNHKIAWLDSPKKKEPKRRKIKEMAKVN